MASRNKDERAHVNALLYAAAPEMLEVLIHEYKMMCKYCVDESCDYNRDPGAVCGVEMKRVIEKATRKPIDEVIKSGITK